VLVSAGWDTTARLWDTESFQPLILLNVHAGQVNAAAFSRDGSLLATADSQPALYLWDTATKKPLHVLKNLRGEIRSLAFGADGGTLAFNAERQIHLVDPRSGQLRTAQGASAGAKTSIALSPDAARVATNGGGLTPRIWNVAARKIESTLETATTVYGMAYSPDGRSIAGGAGKTLKLWDAATGKLTAEFEGPEEPLTSVAISPDGTMLAGASSSGLSVWLWSVADREPLLIIPDPLDGCTVEALAFHPDGQRLAVGGIDWLATGGSNGAVAVWNIPGRFEEASIFEGATAIALHPSGQRLVFATLEHSLCLWDIPSQQIVQEYLGHESPVTCVAFSPDGAKLVSGSEDRTLRLWHEHGDEMAAWELDTAPTALAFSPDGKVLFTANTNTTCYQVRMADLVRKKS